MNTVYIMTDDGSSEQNKNYIEQVALYTLERERKIDLSCSVLCVSPATIRQYNIEYRKEDYVPDVLSFCNNEKNIARNIFQNIFYNQIDHQENLHCYIGDMIICLSQITQQAIENSIEVLEELTRVIIHGILHLLGHTHFSYKECEPMLCRQEQLVYEFITFANIGKEI